MPDWSKLKLPEGQGLDLIDSNNEEQLKKFAANFPSYQNLSESLVDNKIITPEASKIPAVQAEIRKLHSIVRGLDPKDKAQSQKLANLHNHLHASGKLGRAVKEEDFQ